MGACGSTKDSNKNNQNKATVNRSGTDFEGKKMLIII